MGAHGDQKRALNSLEQELLGVVSGLIWVVGSEAMSHDWAEALVTSGAYLQPYELAFF